MADFQLKFILRETSSRARKIALTHLPTSEKEAYELIIQRIRERTAFTLNSVVLPVLSWVYHAKRLLTLDEMRELLDFRDGNSPDEGSEEEDVGDDFMTSCESLITHEESSGVLRFCHATVREWLPESTIWNDLLSPVEIAKICLNHLDQDEFDEPCIDRQSLRQRQEMYKLSDYTSKYWHQHVRDVEHDASVQDQVLKTFMSQNKRVSILQLADSWLNDPTDDPTHLRLSLLHVICQHGLTVICAAFHDRGFDIDDLYISISGVTNFKASSS